MGADTEGEFPHAETEQPCSLLLYHVIIVLVCFNPPGYWTSSGQLLLLVEIAIGMKRSIFKLQNLKVSTNFKPFFF